MSVKPGDEEAGLEPAPYQEDAGSGVELQEFEAARLLAELRAKVGTEPAGERPGRLSLEAIRTIPELFQPRAMDEKHIGELVRAIGNFGEVEALTVKQVGDEVILIDGHHRLEAYERAKVTTSIPVRYFEGTLEEAVLESGTANSKVKLPMNTQERQNFAWRLVLLGSYSKAEVARASSVSKAQIGNMRAAQKKLGTEATAYRSWWQASKAARGEDVEMSPDEREEWKERQAQDWADRLQKTFSSKLSNSPEIAAMALHLYLGRRLGDVWRELKEYVDDETLEEAEDADF